MKGTLALVGSGEYLPPMESVDRTLLGRLQGKGRVVCLPTAAGAEGPERIAYWSNLGVAHFTRLGAQATAVEVIDRASADDESLAARIQEANFVYLSGGSPVYLYETLTSTKSWAAIQRVLDTGGVVAGCSAGAMIFGERSTPYRGHKGFGYLPGVVILPHFDEMSGWIVSAVKTVLSASLTLLGIEGNTALVCSDGSYTVAGSGGVTVWNRAGKRRYVEGEGVDW